MQLFVVDGKDFTNHITVPSYKVNKDDIYVEWEDAAYGKHKEVVRTKVKGNFKLLYDDIEELDDFFDTIEALKSESDDGSIEATLYLNKLHTVETVNVFIEYSPANEKPFFQKQKVSGFEVSVEER